MLKRDNTGKAGAIGALAEDSTKNCILEHESKYEVWSQVRGKRQPLEPARGAKYVA